jgi:two-component system, cell cycle sensor histidine kinase and response regulator CckA
LIDAVMHMADKTNSRQQEDWQKADARVLGQILAAQNILFALPDKTRLAEFYAQTLISIPGIAACRICLEDRSAQAGEMQDGDCAECEKLRRITGEGSTRIPPDSNFKCKLAHRTDMRLIALDSYQHHFGFFALKIGNSDVFEVYHPFISNLANYVAIALEDLLQKNLLEKAHDELERKVIERTNDLTIANERFSLAARAARLGVWDWNIRKNELVWDDGMYELYGIKREDFAGAYEAWLEGVHPDDRADSDEFSKVARSGERDYDTEFRVVWPDGSIHYLKAYGHIVRDSDGRPLRMTGINYDITDRKRAERELQKSNDLLRGIIEAAPTAIAGLDLEGKVQMVWNPAAEKMLGWKAEEVMGRILPSVPAENQEEFKRFREWIRSGKTLDGVEVRRLRRDGTPIHYSIYASPLHDLEGRITGNVCVLVDITERKRGEEEKERLQRQLLQAQKMESLGTLAGGIAHDFNNLLQVILGYSDMLLFNKKPSDTEYEGLHAIRQAGKDGSELAKRILAFSRRLEPNARPVDLNNEIRRIQKMLERTVSKMIRIDILLADNPMPVNADPGQMEQILLNLAVNAQHAMPDGGRLTIETANVTLGKDYSRTHLDVEPGKYVLLTVSDTGQGIDKEAMEHIFEPFFTTKGPGEGTGLGLAMVFGIVKSHKGQINCYSEPGTGTTFKIYLPAIAREIEQDPAVTQRMPAFGTETILLVDDEKSIRKLGEQMLRMAGYSVFMATNGLEALEVYCANLDRIALVLLDLMMPEMGGKRCLEELLKINPRVKVVIASGYSAAAMTRDMLALGAKSSVDKPYDMRQLLEVVRDVLNAE